MSAVYARTQRLVEVSGQVKAGCGLKDGESAEVTALISDASHHRLVHCVSKSCVK